MDPGSSDLSDLVTPTSIVAGEALAGKKAVFARVAGLAASRLGCDPAMVAEGLAERERLGSTGFGGGVAIPHAKVAGLTGISGYVVRVERPIEFQAVDHAPVDVILALLSPPDAGADHLKALARVSRRLRDGGFVAKLRGAGSADAIYALLSGEEARDAA
jgi:nitrogen PTS system EIIA component